MFDLAIIVLRWLQMTGAMILFGSSLFFLGMLGLAAANRFHLSPRLGRGLKRRSPPRCGEALIGKQGSRSP